MDVRVSASVGEGGKLIRRERHCPGKAPGSAEAPSIEIGEIDQHTYRLENRRRAMNVRGIRCGG